jgi:Clostripain family
MPRKKKWTVLTYIAAHNDLDIIGRDLGKRSVFEILKVGSASDVAHGVLYDGVLDDLQTGAATRYVIGEHGLFEHKEQLGSFDSGDPDELIATAKWLFEQHPAERYGLVLWSHGSGWGPSEIETVAKEARPGGQISPSESKERGGAPGSQALFRTTLRTLLKPDKPAERAILFDDGTGHSLDTLELARVAGAIAESVGQPLELLGMDACLMANIEVAYEARKAVRYLVASEELVPGHSWPYREIYGALRANPDQDGSAFAQLIVDRYVSYYTAKPPAGGDVTKVALDLGGIAEVAHRLNLLADALLSKIDSQAAVLWKAQSKTRRDEEGPRKPTHPNINERVTKFDYHLWDIGTLARELLSTAEEPSVKAAARSLQEILAPGAGVVLAEAHLGSWFDGIAGASVYLVRPPTSISPYYARLSLAQDTRWGELLSAYQQVYK